MKINLTKLLEREHRVKKLTQDKGTAASPMPIETDTSCERPYSFELEEQQEEASHE